MPLRTGGRAITAPRRSKLGAITILDQKFSFEKRGKQKFLVHPKWSLTGVGRNLSEAFMSLLEEASDVAEFYLAQEDKKLTEEAKALKNFLRIVAA